MSENVQDFPSDYDDYYYRCRIHQIEKAKKDYDVYNRCLIDNFDYIFDLNELSSDRQAELKSVKKRHKRIKYQYDKISNILIRKEGIFSVEQYKKYMENLMLIANETIVYCYENYGMLDRKKLKKKISLPGFKKNKKVKFVLQQNKNIPFLLNMDDSVNTTIDKGRNILVWIIFIVTFLMSVYFIQLGYSLYEYIKQNGFSITELFHDKNGLACLVSLIIASLICVLVITSKGYKITGIRSEAYKKTKKMFIMPYNQKSKIKAKDLKSTIEFIVNMIKALKE